MGYRSRYECVRAARSSQVRERNDARGISAWFRLSSITRLDVSLSIAMAMVPGNSLHLPPSPPSRIIPSGKFLSRRHWLCPSPQLNPYFRWFQRVVPGPFVFDLLPICLELYILSKRIFRLEIIFFFPPLFLRLREIWKKELLNISEYLYK